MAPYDSFQSVYEAILNAQAVIKWGFELETSDEGGALTDDEDSFNRQWLTKSQPLATQVQKLLISFYKVGKM